MGTDTTPRTGRTTAAGVRLWIGWVLCFGAIGLIVLLAVPGLSKYTTSLIFAAFGAACLATRRMYHCRITGPVFLLIAGMLALAAASVLEVSPWFVAIATLAGLGLGFGLERWCAR